MTYDIATRVSNAQSLAGLPFALSESSIPIITNTTNGPLSVAGRDIGRGEHLFFRLHVTTAFSGGGIASLAVSVVMSVNADLSAGSFVGTSTFTLSGLELGNELDVHIPSLSENLVVGSQFLGLFYAPSAAPVAGALSAFIPLGHSPRFPRRLLGNYSGPTG